MRRSLSYVLKAGALAAAVLAGTDRLEAQGTDANGQITDWLIVGPFANGFGCSGVEDDILLNQIAPACIRCEYPLESDTLDYDELEAATDFYAGLDVAPTWTVFDDGTPDGDQDLQAWATNGGVQSDNTMAWLVTYVEYTGEERDVDICFGSDDGGQVWIDGQLVWSNNACRGRAVCQDTTTYRMRPGVHRVAAAAWNGGGGYGLSFGFRIDGQNVTTAAFPEFTFHGTTPPAGFTPPDCDCEDIGEGCFDLTVAPPALTVRAGDAAQLSIRARTDLGIPFTVTDATIEVEPAGIVSVTPDGTVTADGATGDQATVTVSCGDESVEVTVFILNFLDLGGITAGGDGINPPPAGNIGINADTGTFVQARINANVVDTNLINPQPVNGLDGADDHPLIDSTFIIESDIGQPITSTGVQFDFATGDASNGWENILDGREPGGPDDLSFGAGVGPFTRGVGVHAAQGITYDLDEIREEYGDEAVQYFTGVAGEASGQVNGHVNAYVIFSTDVDVIGFTSVMDARDSGEFLQLPIPEEARFLTLAVGAANDGVGSDHGAFGEAQITDGPIDSSCKEITATPALSEVAPGGTVQLAVTCLTNAATSEAITEDPATSYASADSGIASVSSAGLVTGVAEGETTIDISYETGGAPLTTSVAITVVQRIDLGAIVAGSDGLSAPPAGNIGINADTGTFVQARIGANVDELTGMNPQPVDGTLGADDSPYIDSVFILQSDVGQPITSSGLVTFDFATGDTTVGWENILNGLEPGGPDSLSFGPGVGPFTRGVGCHASQGITFDLEAMRDDHGAENVRFFSAIAGEASGQANGFVNAYVIVSSEDDVIASYSALGKTDSGDLIEFAIPDEALYLTLAVGSAGDGNGSDHGAFGEAFILAQPSNIVCESISVEPPSVEIREGGTRTLRVTCQTNAGASKDITNDAATTYGSADEGVATVDDAGTVSGETVGETTITVTHSVEGGADLTADVAVTVEDYIDLGDIVTGGDGKGPGPYAAVDLDTGVLLDRATVDTSNVNITDVDGINPSPVAESEYIDSVFLLPAQVQAINQEGVEFEFGAAEIWANSYNHVLGNLTHRIDAGVDEIFSGDLEWETAVGIHAAAGVTFDLRAIRDEYGDDAVRTFKTFAGLDACDSNIAMYVIYSDEEGIVEDPAAPEGFDVWRADIGNVSGVRGTWYEGEIPAGALYVSLVVGGADGIGCAHGVFANPRIYGGGTVEPGDVFLRADADASGAINITDGIFILNFLFLGGPQPTCRDAADSDDSGAINITDGIYVLNFLFLGGPDPLPPYPGCGVDPTDDDGIDCLESHEDCL